MADVLELLSGWVENLDVRGQVFLPVRLGEVVEGFIGNRGNVKFVVADGQQVIWDILEDGVRDSSVGSGSIRKAVSIMKVA